MQPERGVGGAESKCIRPLGIGGEEMLHAGRRPLARIAGPRREGSAFEADAAKVPSRLCRCTRKRAARTPSTTRWSHDRHCGRISRGSNCLPSHTGFVCARGDAEDRDFGRVDDRREGRAADAAEARHREAAALMSAGPSLPSRAFFASSRPRRDVEETLAVRVADHRTTSPFGVSAANAMWKYFLRTRFSPSRLALNSGNCAAPTRRP